MKSTAILIIILYCTVFAKCNKDIIGCADSSYNFQLNARVLSDKDTVSIGDTIWVEINFPVVFTDLNTSQQVDFSNANNLGTDMGFVKLSNLSPIEVTYAVDSFQFVLLVGKETYSPVPHLEKDFLISEVNGKYVFKLGIIPKSSGIYRFNMGNPVNVYRNGNSCPKADFNIILVQTNNHYYLFPGGANVSTPSSNYCFYVR